MAAFDDQVSGGPWVDPRGAVTMAVDREAGTVSVTIRAAEMRQGGPVVILDGEQMTQEEADWRTINDWMRRKTAELRAA